MKLQSLCFKYFCKSAVLTSTKHCLRSRKCNFHTLCAVSKLMGFRATYSHLRYLANSVVHPFASVIKMKEFLANNHLPYAEGPTCLHIPCPNCCPNKERTMENTMFINMKSGMFICYSCKQTGMWQSFQDYITMLKRSKTKNELRLPLQQTHLFLSEKEEKEVNRVIQESICISELSDKEILNLSKIFGFKVLTLSSLMNFGVRTDSGFTSLLFPMEGIHQKITAVKILSCKSNSNIQELIIPKKPVIAIFGLSQLKESQQTVVLTSTPFDAMAVSQESDVSAVALPGKYLYEEMLPLFERFEKVIIWFGPNLEEKKVANVLAEKLNNKRCRFLWSEGNNMTPVGCLQKKKSVSRMLEKAESFYHPSIITSSALRAEIFAELGNEEKIQGVKWKRFTTLNKLLKGHRPGELTVFTGPTGSGKTTFISEYSLDLCMQGVCTLWGSFELNNTRLLKMMLTQFAQYPLNKNPEQYSYWIDKFEQLPLYLMTFHGQQEVHKVKDTKENSLLSSSDGSSSEVSLESDEVSEAVSGLEDDSTSAMQHAVYFYGTQHIIIDNVQFMLSNKNMNSSVDRFWQQDLAVSIFRQFATENNCHITLIMHPRKELEELNIHSIYGGARASQEADNVLILQDKRITTVRGRKYLQIIKNRFDGDLGIMPLEFDKETLSFSTKKKQKKAIEPESKSDETSDNT